jgi:hypothetical protein
LVGDRGVAKKRNRWKIEGLLKREIGRRERGVAKKRNWLEIEGWLSREIS